MTHPWHDKECKIARREIKETIEEFLKVDKINMYKSLIKRKRRTYVNNKQEKLSHLSKMDPNKLWRQILTRKTKADNMIVLKDWNSYLRMLYESNDVVDNIQPLFMEDKVFSLEDIDFGI